MAACARCGAVPEPGAAACPTCGTPLGPAPAAAPPAEGRVGSGTLLLGSGVPIDGPLPDRPRAEPTREPVRRRTPEPRQERRPARDPRQERQRLPRIERKPIRPEPSEPALPVAPARSKRAWLIVPAALVLVLAVALALGHRRRELRGTVRFDPRGHPELHVSCARCADGTTLALGVDTATVTGGRAVLPMAPPVSLGRYEAVVEVRPPDQRARAEKLEYTVDFVVSADQRGLAHPEPKLALVFEAGPELAFVVDGRVIPPGPSGIRRYELGVRADLTGAAKAPVKLVKKLPYSAKLPSGETWKSEIELAIDVVMLQVDAPGDSIVIEGSSFVLAGSTEKDGMITVEGRAITVDPTGRFAQLMSVSAVGDTTVNVRASAPGRAPRFVPIHVKRVASLAAEAAEFERRAQGSYAAIASDVEQKRGWAVVLDGKLTEVKSDGYASSLVLDVEKGCKEPPCLVQLRLGERTSLAAGASVTAYGHLAGMSQNPSGGRSLPEVRVEFLRGRP